MHHEPLRLKELNVVGKDFLDLRGWAQNIAKRVANLNLSL